ncbi:MAG: DUF3106 domain-containing protein [Burkholderiaceae bacterium]|jgi:hypothetical protein|nr:DUF3106 domain-containing protein [Burkholderiaceae bacterium]
MRDKVTHLQRTLPALLLLGALGAAAPAWAQKTAAPSQTVGAIAWSSLSAEQKKALQPLNGLWPMLTEEDQRKWIALAHNYNRMTPAAQATLQSRMTQWAILSPAQRAQARLNFGETQTQKMSRDDIKARWQAYQYLPAEERSKLAAQRGKQPPATAAAPRPAAPDKILRNVRPNAGALPRGGASDAAAPFNRNTLLPR